MNQQPQSQAFRTSVDRLRVGVHISLEGFNWFKHPFLRSNFKIKSRRQIETLRQMGIQEVAYDPDKSDRLPLDATGDTAGEPDLPEPADDGEALSIEDQWKIKKERVLKLRQKREHLEKVQKRYKAALDDVGAIIQGVSGLNPESLQKAVLFTDSLADVFLADAETTLNLMNLSAGEDIVYFHSLNVTVLSLMLGRAAKFSGKEMKLLGFGALMHDIGKMRIEKKLLRKRGKLTTSEQKYLRMHPIFGEEVLQKMKGVPQDVLPIVLQHHERNDGTGYPRGLKSYEINKLAKVVAITNAYDNHCNHLDPGDSLTPYQALSYMFTKQKAQFEPELLAQFIRCLGIYPPGTIVKLNNGGIGVVVSVNPKNQLWPSLVVYDKHIPKKEALIIDLEEEPDLKVEKSLRPSDLPQEIFDYLSPKTRITYYVDDQADEQQPA